MIDDGVEESLQGLRVIGLGTLAGWLSNHSGRAVGIREYRAHKGT